MEKISKDIIKLIAKAADQAGGYLTTELFDKNRGDLPTWDTLKKRYKITFEELLKEAKVMNKVEFAIERNKIKAISNFKILQLEYGYVSRSDYDTGDYTPSSDYVAKHYGWNEIAQLAKVKLQEGKYSSIEEKLQTMKDSIKKLGYIPNKDEYDKNNLIPNRKSLASEELSLFAAMRKVGYRPMGRGTKVKDRVCRSGRCYRQFTPDNENDFYCNECFKDERATLINNIDEMNVSDLEILVKKLTSTDYSYAFEGLQTLRDTTKKLLYLSNSQEIIMKIDK